MGFKDNTNISPFSVTEDSPILNKNKKNIQKVMLANEKNLI